MSGTTSASWRHERASELFLAACEVPPGQREAFLHQHCGTDEQLRLDVIELLAHDTEFAAIDRPVIEVGSFPLALDARNRASAMPTHIGQYEILEVLGEGGMATIYKARQENPNRMVAIKVIRAGLTSRSIVKRFELEAHLLGRLQHPGIAHIYEAGTADTGFGMQPYFAMELVVGARLIDYANQKSLSRRARLELIARIAEAVHHAHLKGIVHRDLKPANILVNEAGEPKILDFGIARITDTDLKTTTLQTNVGEMIGTLAYMSPEQIAGDPMETDVRSDVYALGVITFELLCGRLPHDVNGKSIVEAARVIRTQPPTRLAAIDRNHRGDVDTIVTKAIEREKTRRYQSASELAADIRRCLNDEPIVARPPSAVYQMRKFARRHRALVVGATVAVALLLAAIVGTSYGLVVARAQRNQAQRAADKAEALRTFFLNVLTTPAPDAAGRDVTVVEALRISEKAVADAFPNQPELRGDVHAEIAVALVKLGDTEQAEGHARESLRIRRETLGEQHSDTITAMNNLAGVLLQPDRRAHPGALTEAGDLLDQAIILLRSHHSDRPELLFPPLTQRADVAFQSKDYDRAEDLTREAIDVARRNFGPEDSRTIEQRHNLAMLLSARDRKEEAVTELRSVVATFAAINGTDHTTTLNAQHSLAGVLREMNRFDEAESIYRENLAAVRKRFGDDHLSTIIWINDFAYCLKMQSKKADAAQVYREALNLANAKLGPTNFMTTVIKDSLALTLSSLGEFDQSAALHRECLEALTAQFGPTSEQALGSVCKLATALLRAKRASEAMAVCDEALGVIPADDLDKRARAIDIRCFRARALQLAGRTDEAMRSFDAILPVYQTLSDRQYFLTIDAINGAIDACNAMGHEDRAAAFRKLLATSG